MKYIIIILIANNCTYRWGKIPIIEWKQFGVVKALYCSSLHDPNDTQPKYHLSNIPSGITKGDEIFHVGATFEIRTTLYKICLLNDQDSNAWQG